MKSRERLLLWAGAAILLSLGGCGHVCRVKLQDEASQQSDWFGPELHFKRGKAWSVAGLPNGATVYLAPPSAEILSSCADCGDTERKFNRLMTSHWSSFVGAPCQRIRVSADPGGAEYIGETRLVYFREPHLIEKFPTILGSVPELCTLWFRLRDARTQKVVFGFVLNGSWGNERDLWTTARRLGIEMDKHAIPRTQ